MACVTSGSWNKGGGSGYRPRQGGRPPFSIPPPSEAVLWWFVCGGEDSSILSTPSPCCDLLLRAHLALILLRASAWMPTLTLPNMPMRLGRMVEMILVGLPLCITLSSTWVLRASRFGDSKILFHRHMGISITAMCYEYHGSVRSCVCQEGRWPEFLLAQGSGRLAGSFFFPYLFFSGCVHLSSAEAGFGLLSLYHLDVIIFESNKAPFI